MLFTRRFSPLLALIFAFSSAACIDDGTRATETNGEPNSANSSANSANSSTNANTGSNNLNIGTNNAMKQVAAVEIEPSAVTLTASPGTQPEQEFALVVTFEDGTTSRSLATEWEIDEINVGRIGERNGVFVANGTQGGEATITATLVGQPQSATATVTVDWSAELFVDGTSPDAATTFGMPGIDDPSRTAEIVYPLEGAVMPQNVFPADIQWERGVEGDLFRVTLAKPNARAVAYLTHTGANFGNHWLADETAWRAVAQSDPNADLTINVDRWEATSGDVIRGQPMTMRFAEAALSGSVYYWDIAAGRIVRINDGEGVRDEFMPTPPSSPDGQSCVGCHTVSNDGRYMVGRLGGGFNAGAVFDLTNDLTQSPVPTEYAISGSSPYWNFATWSPDNTRLVASGNEWALEGMKLVEPFAGTEVPVASGTLPGSGSTHPAWSPDGSLLAYVENAGGFGGSNTTGDIAVMEVTGQDTFGAAEVIQPGTAVTNAAPAGNAASYPTWTPDSAWLAFAHGTGSRSEDQRSALYLIKPDGTGLVRLDNASGGPNADNTFLPNFSPFDQGGYFWMSYLTRRDYGNAAVGTKGSGLQQIWVSAVNANPAPGEDPSEVGYWLPGQNTESRNISAYWAPRACRSDGESCSVASECCSGECIPDGSGATVCSPPPPDRCREIGESCNQTSDCCEITNGQRVCEQNACIRIVN